MCLQNKTVLDGNLLLNVVDDVTYSVVADVTDDVGFVDVGAAVWIVDDSVAVTVTDDVVTLTLFVDSVVEGASVGCGPHVPQQELAMVAAS